MAAAPVKNKELSSLGALFYTQAIPLGLHIKQVRSAECGFRSEEGVVGFPAQSPTPGQWLGFSFSELVTNSEKEKIIVGRP